MAKQPLTIPIDPASDLARALADAETSVVLASDGVRYIVERENEDVFASYDPQATLRALRLSRGALAGVDVESLLADLDDQRSQDTSRRPA